MTRILLAILAALTMCVMLPGCEEGDADDEAMKQRRDAPPPRAAPGSEIGANAGEDQPAGDQPPPSTQGGE